MLWYSGNGDNFYVRKANDVNGDKIYLQETMDLFDLITLKSVVH